MVSSAGSQFESAVFQRVIGSLASEIEFGADVDVDGIEEDGGRAGDGADSGARRRKALSARESGDKQAEVQENAEYKDSLAQGKHYTESYLSILGVTRQLAG